jgi:hypothetical protein
VTASALAGAGLLEDAHQIVTGIRDGSWIDASLGGVSGSLEALSLVLDPLGSIVSWGVGWLLEHVSVLREALDGLAGNADEVNAHATAWQQVAASMASARESYLASGVSGWAGASGVSGWAGASGMSGWAGASADAYRDHASVHAATLEGISVAAGGIGAAVQATGLLVALVREIVRDLIADFVATLAARLPQWLAMEGLTLGVASPLVASQVAALVAKWAGRIQGFVRGLLSSLRNLLPRTDSLKGVLEALQRLLQRLMRKSPFQADRMDASAEPPARGTTGGDAGGSPGFTAPSGSPDPNHRPRGERTDEKDSRGLRRENEAADLIAQRGFDIEQNPAPKANGKEPDYKIEGEYFDCSAPETSDISQIRKGLSRKVREDQADRLILYMDDTPRTTDEVAAILERRPIKGLKEIIVVQGGELIPFYPFGE